ncbi:TRAP transporter small permease subunit [Seohaeicola nanhaiensis]|uniref:TRAP transporter small permease protein n=1 Tax=Seohaeicola nanhaiensis TaxID=1387282 RepID=A0ABV9KF34_9RHOB
MLDGIVWVFSHILGGFANIAIALTHPSLWLDWSNKEAIMRVVYYGGSVEFFFAVFDLFLLLTIAVVVNRRFGWATVRVMEGFGNIVGRTFAWAGLIMVLQQIIIVFIQRVFARADMAFGFGIPLQYDISWWGEELKLYNAIIICLCLSYTFVQGGHVRVDLVYSAVSFRAKRVIDMVGCMLFMVPMAVVIWMYGWYFMWRHLIVPKPSASDTLDRLLMKSKALKWNVERIGFSPNGFDHYYIFKVLLCLLAAMIFIHAFTFLYRSYLEFVEGEESAGKYLDKDTLGEGEEAYEGTH